MKPYLELKLGQNLTITPQLQQAIRLLQLSSIELQTEIQEALESNPLLEEEDTQTNEAQAAESDSPGESNIGSDGANESADNQAENTSAEDMDWQLGADEGMGSGSGAGADDDLPDIEARNSAPETLADHLEWQLQMMPLSQRDKKIAYALIDAISEDGYLAAPLEEIRDCLERDKDEVDVELDEIEAVLHQIQNLDPLGVGARTLAECLQLQLKNLDPDTPCLENAKRLATEANLQLLAKRDHARLRKETRMGTDELQNTIQLIQQLNPRPGAAVNAPQASYIVPDIIIRKRKGIWRAELNPDVAPRLRINRGYEHLLRSNGSTGDKKYLQDQLQQAKWLIKSVKSRNETLLKVAKTIVDRQRAFFDHGPEAMKPLVLHDVAEAVEMHESTISRVTTNKYMLTPRGILELKYFFSSHVATSDGGTCSATAIRSLIKKLVEGESANKPISDSQIAKILEEQGINVARRTIAKYRESMNIPPSNQRKALI